MRASQFFHVVVVCAALTILQCGNCYGQATSGVVTGLVTDPSGAAVPGAEVTVTVVSSGVTFRAVTNDLGSYTVAYLPAAQCTVRVEKVGFKTFLRENVLVTVGSTIRVDVPLEVGSVSEQVVVAGAPPELQTERADVSQVLRTGTVEQLPTLGRNVAMLQLLVPGMDNSLGAVGLAENPQQSPAFVSNGQPNGARNMLLDGVDDNENVLGQDIVIPDQDSVAEVKVSSSSWDAEYGRVGGALVQIQTKSGTNALHGSVFDFLRNNATNARDSFTNPNGAPPYKWNQFGGSLGGPIKKDKTFLFGDYQGTRNHLGNGFVETVPTAAMRNGDFSQLVDSSGKQIPIFDPQTGNPDGSGRTQFAGNMIPANRFSSVGVNLMALLPAPTVANSEVNNYINSAVTKFNTNQYSARADQYFTQNTRFFVRYIYFGSSLFSPPVFGEGGGPAAMSGVGGYSNGRNQDLSANLVRVVTPNVLLETRFGYSRYRIATMQPDYATSLSNTVGIPGVNMGTLDTSGLGTMTVSGIAGFSMGGANTCNCPLHETMDYYQGVANLTWIRGKHTFKFGVDERRYTNFRLTTNNMRGSFTFSQGDTGSPAISNSGAGTASMLLGLVGSYSREFLNSQVGTEQEWHLFEYAQDTWRVTKRFTINYGLRYELYTPPATPVGAGANLDINTGNVMVAGIGGISRSVNVKTALHDFGPRLGLAYSLSDKTVIRAGAARSFFPNVYNVLISGNWPVIGTQTVSPTYTDVAVFNIANVYPAPTPPVVPSTGLLPLPNGISYTWNPLNRLNGMTDNWNFTVQHLLPWGINTETAYVGNVGRHLYWNVHDNAPIPGPGPINPRLPYYAEFGWTQSITTRTNAGSSSYNSLQMRAEKQATRGLVFIASFVWQKAMNFGSGANSYDNVGDPNNVRPNKGVADYNRISEFSLGHTYQLPLGPGQHFLRNAKGVAKQIVSGWSFNGVTTARSGLPLTPTVSSKATLNGATWSLRPDPVSSNFYAATKTRNQWFNVAAFAVPGLYRQGYLGRATLRGPGFFEADWALSKDFPLTEKVKLQFRWESFNAFNNTNMANPGTTIDTPAGGVITDVIMPMRQMQWGLRLSW